ncbi:hypothetical protein EV360DRAFT_72358 [Lentinula raphanica]|nr:hypothetical protein EV360DRAFT_72358 [Lentinula raphanica]
MATSTRTALVRPKTKPFNHTNIRMVPNVSQVPNVSNVSAPNVPDAMEASSAWFRPWEGWKGHYDEDEDEDLKRYSKPQPSTSSNVMNGFAIVGDSEATFTSSTSRSIPDTSASSPSPPSTPTTPTTPISKIHPTFKPSPPYPYPIRTRRTNDPRDAPGLAFSRVLFDLPVGDLASSVQSGETTEGTETTESKEIIETRSSTSTPPPPTSHSVTTETESARSPSPSPSSSIPSTPFATPSQSSITSVSASVPASTPTPTSTPPVPKKSWASLLRSSSPSSPSSLSSSHSSTASPSSATSPSTGGRQRLRTSSVVGTSVPGPSSTSTMAENSVLDKKRKELLSLLSSRVSLPSSNEGKMHPRGLINTGNMCFANSVLQMLIYTPEFAALVGALGRVASSGGTGVGQIAGVETPLVDATVEFLGLHQEQQASSSSSSSSSRTTTTTAPSSNPAQSSSSHDPFCPFIPSPIYTALKSKPQFDHMPMNGAQQEDAEEFLGFFLDGLEEELGRVRGALESSEGEKGKVKGKGKEREHKEYEEGAEEIQQQADSEDGWVQVGKNNHTTTVLAHTSTSMPPSPLTHIFTGHFRSTIRIRGHKEDRATLEEWRSLRLDIQSPGIHSIQDALSALSQPQTLNLTTPQKQEVEASQQVLIESLPPVLVVQLKRFQYVPPSTHTSTDGEEDDRGIGSSHHHDGTGVNGGTNGVGPAGGGTVGIGSVIKITKEIAFGPELVVGSDVLSVKARAEAGLIGGLGNRGAMGGSVGVKSAGGGAWGNARGVRYKLFGVIYHHGLSAEGGHYTIDVLHPLPSVSSSASSSASSWTRIDDDIVMPISPADVFSFSPSAGKENQDLNW